MNAKKKLEPFFGDADAETKEEAALSAEEARAARAAEGAGIVLPPEPEEPKDPRTGIHWVCFISRETRVATSSSGIPAMAEEGNVRMYLDCIEGVHGIAIVDPSIPRPGFIPMTNVASMGIKR